MKAAIYTGALALLALAASLLVARPDSAHAGIGDWAVHGFADFNADCIVDVLDIQAVAFRYGSRSGMPFYETRYDVEPYATKGYYDWDIDIKDVQFVFGRDYFECKEFWDVQTSMGSYSYRGSSNCTGTSNYVDPITVVLTNIPTSMRANFASVLEQELKDHGLPYIDDDGEQRFWEIGECTYEDVDVAQNAGGCNPTTWPPCPYFDAWERFHIRAEAGAGVGYMWNEYWAEWYPCGGHPDWKTFAVATPHFDDDDNTCGHFVPQDYPYWHDLCSSCTGSGFDAGREWVRQQFGTPIRIEYWGNRQPILQGCGDNQWPASDGWVYYIQVS